MRVLSPLRILAPVAAALLLLTTPTALAVRVKPPPPAALEEEPSPIVQACQATLSQRLPYLLAATIVASTTDFLVQKCFNESHYLELKHEKGQYKETLLYAVAESIDVGAKAYAVTIAADIVTSIFPVLKNALPFQANLFQAAPQIGFLIWSIKSVSSIKHLVLNKLVMGRRLGKLAFFDRITDLGLGIAAGYNVLQILEYQLGVSLNSFFAASGVSAIVFSLASKGMIEQMVGGLLLQAWDAIEVGEKVRLGDGTEGTIVRIGLVETEVMGGDHVPIRVPNSQIIGKRVHMFSKVSKSKVKQTLRFKYSDLSKLPNLLKDIKQEIIVACQEKMLGEPDVLLANYEADHLQVSVSCSFDFKPDSPEYDATKQRALFAIAKAVKKNDVEFALPAIQYETKNNNGSQQILQGA